MAIGQAQLNVAMERSVRLQRSTDLPLFYGSKDKDTVEPLFLVERVEWAAGVANWNQDQRKIDEFKLSLQDKALIWWKTLADTNINQAVWAEVRREFLKAYEPRFLARTNCTHFQDLVQRSGESVHDYYLKVHNTFMKLGDAKPITISTTITLVNALDDDDQGALLTIKNEGIIQALQ